MLKTSSFQIPGMESRLRRLRGALLPSSLPSPPLPHPTPVPHHCKVPSNFFAGIDCIIWITLAKYHFPFFLILTRVCILLASYFTSCYDSHVKRMLHATQFTVVYRKITVTTRQIDMIWTGHRNLFMLTQSRTVNQIMNSTWNKYTRYNSYVLRFKPWYFVFQISTYIIHRKSL